MYNRMFLHAFRFTNDYSNKYFFSFAFFILFLSTIKVLSSDRYVGASFVRVFHRIFVYSMNRFVDRTVLFWTLNAKSLYLAPTTFRFGGWCVLQEQYGRKTWIIKQEKK